MNKRNNKNYKRLQFEFHIDSISRLDSLLVKTDAENRSAVVKKALQLYEFILNEQKAGNKFILKDAKNNSESLIAPIAL